MNLLSKIYFIEYPYSIFIIKFVHQKLSNIVKNVLLHKDSYYLSRQLLKFIQKLNFGKPLMALKIYRTFNLYQNLPMYQKKNSNLSILQDSDNRS